jgi:hypothetical protein
MMMNLVRKGKGGEFKNWSKRNKIQGPASLAPVLLLSSSILVSLFFRAGAWI